MTVREGLSPFSGIICEIVCSVGQGNFTFVRKKSGKFSNPMSNMFILLSLNTCC